MLPSRTNSRLRSALVAVLLSLLALLALAAAAPAAEPATVTVEIEGLSETKLPPTQVTTTTAPVIEDGNPEHACPGTNAAGALQLATAGNWSGKWYGGEVKEGKFVGLGYTVESIDGESHTFGSGYYWEFWLNHKLEEEEGVCEAELHTGDQVLLFPCPETGTCPTPLGIEAPASAEANEPVTVTVSQYNAKGEVSPAMGATVSGGGTSATTDFQGHATLKFYGDGTYTLEAIGSNEAPTPGVRTETTICVHEGNDGTCGTKAPVQSGPGSSPSSGSILNTGPPPLVLAKIAGVSNGHVYHRRKAPRVLKGMVAVPAGQQLRDVEISLKRRSRGHCLQFSGRKGRFVAIKCGRAAAFFSVGANPSFSYLLPARLSRGSYTYEIEAVDGAGQATKPIDGVSRVVFRVR
jgi:hypothetical protein